MAIIVEKERLDGDKEDVESNLAYDIYTVCSRYYEYQEHNGRIIRNGHHMAQDISSEAKRILHEAWRDEQ